ncbi:hypothetical protein H0X09_00625 [Candidatus Saccharibacteria bacterium]|nr:hypothetical protein [Candidatus Saccharibacteria bacterium]
MEDNKILKVIYTFFLGFLIAIFVGVGISTFYEAPKAPEWQNGYSYAEKPSTEEEAKQKQFNKEIEQHSKAMKPYSRNVSIITLAAAVLLLAVSLIFEKKIKIIADGIMLGGLFTLIYSIGKSFASEDSKYTFGVVTVGLAVALYLGYHRFIRPDKPRKQKRK